MTCWMTLRINTGGTVLSSQSKAVLIFVILVLIWGSAFILIKRGNVALSPLQVGALRVLAASIVLGPFAFGKFGQIEKKEWVFVILSGLVGSLIPALLFAIGMKNGVSSSTAGILSALTPAFTVLLGFVMFKDRITFIQIVGLFLGFLAALSLLWTRSNSGFEFNIYGWLIVFATFCYALNLVLVKFKLKETKPILITSISLIFTIPFTIGILVYTISDFSIFYEKPVIISTAYSVLLGVLATGIALQLFNELIKISTPMFSSSITYAIPVMAIIWALIDGETISLSTYALAVLIILSIYLIRYDHSKRIK